MIYRVKRILPHKIVEMRSSRRARRALTANVESLARGMVPEYISGTKIEHYAQLVLDDVPLRETKMGSVTIGGNVDIGMSSASAEIEAGESRETSQTLRSKAVALTKALEKRKAVARICDDIHPGDMVAISMPCVSGFLKTKGYRLPEEEYKNVWFWNGNYGPNVLYAMGSAKWVSGRLPFSQDEGFAWDPSCGSEDYELIRKITDFEIKRHGVIPSDELNWDSVLDHLGSWLHAGTNRLGDGRQRWCSILLRCDYAGMDAYGRRVLVGSPLWACYLKKAKYGWYSLGNTIVRKGSHFAEWDGCKWTGRVGEYDGDYLWRLLDRETAFDDVAKLPSFPVMEQNTEVQYEWDVSWI